MDRYSRRPEGTKGTSRPGNDERTGMTRVLVQRVDQYDKRTSTMGRLV